MRDTLDINVALDLMDERWPGYANAKKIIRDEIERLRNDRASCKNFGEIMDALKWAGIGGLMRIKIMKRLATPSVPRKENR